MKKGLFYMLLIGLSMAGCKHEHKHQDGNEDGHKHHHHGDANHYMNQSSLEELVERFEGADRDQWQKPDEVIKMLQVDSNSTWMDIGSGTGYFSFRLQNAGAKVICGDVDERFLKYIEKKRDSLGIAPEKMELRKLPFDAPNLKEKEVDGVLIVNTYHHIEDRISYFKAVKNGLKEGGKLVVIDFLKKETPVGPPVEMKIPAGKVMDELKQAGFMELVVNRELLPYQFVVIGR
jgi:ubiquinone/menaquinone biosynthesis C-methylase UbiE